MKSYVTYLLVVTNLLSIAAIAYILGTKPKSPPPPQCPQYERSEFTILASGYRKHVGTNSDELGNTWPKFSDSLFLRRGEPFVFLTGQTYWPVDDSLDMRPEFYSGIDYDWGTDSLKWPETVELDHSGNHCVITVPTDTVDMQGKKIKALRLYPRIRTPHADTLQEWRDTVEVFIVDEK
ncbi:MAG: hypothetical protein IPN95_27495 [Bacteroidetes bacterium]|nr:hypothetical protein [Bacteroidota bacterium]